MDANIAPEIIGGIADSNTETLIDRPTPAHTYLYNTTKNKGVIINLKAKPKLKKPQCLLRVSHFNCKPTANKATGVTVAPNCLHTSRTISGKSTWNTSNKNANANAIKGGKTTTFRKALLMLDEPVANNEAVNTPRVESTINEPG